MFLNQESYNVIIKNIKKLKTNIKTFIKYNIDVSDLKCTQNVPLKDSNQ